MRVLGAYSAVAVAHARAGAVVHRQHGHSLVGAELEGVRSSLLGLLGPAHAGLRDVGRVLLVQRSQQLRALVVLLFGHATNGLGPSWRAKHSAAAQESVHDQLDTPLTRPDVLHNSHPTMPNHTASFSGVFHIPKVPPPPPRPALVAPSFRLLPTQLRLAQIVEMIHIAAVLHDTVHDGPQPDTDGFGNKLSILAGDFLLGRASAALSRLAEAEVVELIASVIANQAEGEVTQVQEQDAWEVYLRKTYLKTASLFAKAARASVILGGCSTDWKDIAYAYGRNIGIAYQLIEDTLEYESTPSGGLLTGPLLFASEEHPSLLPLIRRSLTGEGDVERARDYVARSAGVERTRALALTYAEKAREVLGSLPDTDHRDALDLLAECVVTRTW